MENPNVILTGGPTFLIHEEDRVRYIANTNSKVKVLSGNRYEHFEPTDETVVEGNRGCSPGAAAPTSPSRPTENDPRGSGPASRRAAAFSVLGPCLWRPHPSTERGRGEVLRSIVTP